MTDEGLAAEIERLCALVEQPAPPPPICWCCGVRDRAAVEDMFATGRALCRACVATNPAADQQARASAALYALLTAQVGAAGLGTLSRHRW